MVVFPTACACFIDTNPVWVAGTFTVSSIFAGVVYAGLCAQSAPSDIADTDRES